jgi:hypothetical protein
MWCSGRKYHTKFLNDKKNTCDSGIIAIFHVTNIFHSGDKHLITFYLTYYDYLEYILDIELKSFKVVLFKVRVYILLLQGDESIVIDHDNRFTVTNTTR